MQLDIDYNEIDNDVIIKLIIDRIMIKNIDKHIVSDLYIIDHFNNSKNETFSISNENPFVSITLSDFDEEEHIHIDPNNHY